MSEETERLESLLKQRWEEAQKKDIIGKALDIIAAFGKPTIEYGDSNESTVEFELGYLKISSSIILDSPSKSQTLLIKYRDEIVFRICSKERIPITSFKLEEIDKYIPEKHWETALGCVSFKAKKILDEKRATALKKQLQEDFGFPAEVL